MTKDHLQLLTFSQGVVADYERKNSIGSFLAPEVVVGRFYGDRHAPCHRWTLEDVAPKC